MLRIPEYIKDEETYYRCCPFAYQLEKYVESISGANRWWFRSCSHSMFSPNEFSVLFSSYETPEYRNFVLSIEVRKNGDDWEFTKIKEVTELA